MSEFDVVLTARCSDRDHINLKEARAPLLFVRWVLRVPRHFNRRLVALVHSKVIVGAVAKGRSRSAPLIRLLRRLAGLCFAEGLTLHVVFIPSKYNPADAPSRGVRPRRARGRRGLRSRSRLQRYKDGCSHVLLADPVGDEDTHDRAALELGVELACCSRTILAQARRHDLADSGFVPLGLMQSLLVRLAGRPALRGRIRTLLQDSGAVRGNDLDYARVVRYLDALVVPTAPSSDSSSSSDSDST